MYRIYTADGTRIDAHKDYKTWQEAIREARLLKSQFGIDYYIWRVSYSKHSTHDDNWHEEQFIKPPKD